MTEDMLARRAVASKGWRWLPGMLALPCSSDRTGVRGIPVRVVHVYEGGDGLAVWGDISGVQGSWEEWRWREEGRLPDLTDAPTIGGLLALVREAWKEPSESTEWDTREGVWAWFASTQNKWFTGATEAEALVRALEAAP